MIMTNPFPTIEPIYLLYFSYGAAFLLLSFSIGTKDMKGSNLRIANSLWLLAMFGLLHGIHEIMHIYPLIEGEHLTLEELLGIEILSTTLLTVSFMFLLQFGLSLSHENTRKRLKWTVATYAAFFILLLFIEMPNGFSEHMRTARWVQIGARNTLGVIGSLVTAYGMITYSSSGEIRKLPPVIARNLYYAGIVFAVFAFSKTVAFTEIAHFLDFSLELFGAGMAVLTAYFIIKALNIFDIETRLKVEKQARDLVQSEKLASLGQLAAGIAHEINNPLTNASLGIQMLKNKLKNDSGQMIVEQLSAVEKNIDRAAVIAQELLLFSREREPEFLAVNINEVIASALASMKHKQDRVVIEQNHAPVPEVRGDRGKLEQVFINILSNALEAMPEGGKVTITTALREGMVEADIADTGTGIAEEIVSNVFEPFFTTKEVGSGTGLGLYLCYGIIKQHHGRIELSSIVGQGTTVTIKLPALL